MKIFVPVIDGLVPPKMVYAVSTFIDFCYYARCDVLTKTDLAAMDHLLEEYHQARKIFIETNIRLDFNLPRQHSLVYYVPSIRLFGSPLGLCSSITQLVRHGRRRR